MSARGRHGTFDVGERPQRPEDPEVRRANLRRVTRLFRPERSRLTVVLGLIVVSSALGMVPAFLLRDIIDQAIPEADTTLLAWLAGGMIAIAIIVGILGVAQTYLANRVGQEVMHELRADVYEHLQRQSLAFFTRTRTGEVQSRIANDIGGVDEVVTSTATSVVSNVTTVLAALVAMFLLDWRLAILSVVLVPFFVLLTRRVGAERRRLSTERQKTMADISSLVQESLSVSGVLLGKTMGRGPELATRFRGESRELAELEVRQRMAGRWVMASISASFAILPALVYWAGGWSIATGWGAVSIGTLVAFATIQTRIFFPVGALLSVGIDVQASLALFDRIFEYLDLEVDIDEHEGSRALARADAKGEVAFDDVWFRYAANGPWTIAGATFLAAPGTRTAVVGETGSGKTTLGYLVARLYDAERGTVSIDGVDVRDLSFASLADLVGVVSQETYLFHATVRENLRFACPDA
ncbi:MAG: ABC transporter ATP-binding protein, partial [Actinomycetota bacterium]